ncbi:uncharacterized protein LOC111594159 [Drosophila hydei]|uniref:Uncharacterized protein LOC111594159 n=1 Tax=Drosophila hydei TaxID=7224 RepID=A0A6J1LF58_DROHY|nr:uncharacterized protein LOC111594159 [Drosophila hydei]
MPSKSVSAVQRVTKTVKVYQRHFSGRTLLEKSHDALGMGIHMCHNRSWPVREESYAAVKLLLQNRKLGNFKIGTNNANMNYTNEMSTTPERNLLAIRHVCAKRNKEDKSNAQLLEDSTQGQVESTEKAAQKDENEDVGTVGKVLFEIDKKEDDKARQLEAEAELLKRVTNRRPGFRRTLSKKVIAPYSTYHTHRNTWAEFRHRMIYGGIGY